MSGGGPSAAGPASSRPHSEAKSLELQRKVTECRKPDAYIMKLRHMELTRYLREVEEREKAAAARNQTLLEEFRRLEAHLSAASSALLRRMEAWYGREIRSVLSLQEGNLSAEGDEEEECSEQVPRVGRQAAMPGEQYHPATAFMGCHTSAVTATRGLSMWQKPPQATESCSAPSLPSCSPSLEGLGLKTRSTDVRSDAPMEKAVRPGDLDASEEDSEQLISSASDPKPGSPEEQQPPGSTLGPKPRLSNWWTSKEGSWKSSHEPSVPTSAKGVMPSNPDIPGGMSLPAAGWERDRDARAVEGSSQQPPNPPAGQEPPSLPSLSSAPDGAEPPWDPGVPRALSSHHASLLRQQRVRLPEEVLGTSESLQVGSGTAQDGQALPVLRELLPEECGDRSSTQSNKSSPSLAATPKGGGEMQQAGQASQLAGAGGREVTSWCEDESKEESAVEKNPISGWDRGDDGSKGRTSPEVHSESGSSWKERSPPFSRTETRKRMATAIKSKAFWGESEESSSELEAALRPGAQGRDTDDSDDFYD